MKILLVDDDLMLLEQLGSALTRQRYTVETASEGTQALKMLFGDAFDAVVLDIMMPGPSGLSVLDEMRKAGLDVPVLMLSARGSTEDRVRGLDTGADDYLSKPFSLDEFLARIRALLRRKGGREGSVLRVGDLRLDTVTREVSRSGVRVELSPREFAILEFLLYNKNRVVSRFSLVEHVWRDTFDPFSMSNFMDVHIKNLRRRIGDSAREGIVRTVRGVGYVIRDEEE